MCTHASLLDASFHQVAQPFHIAQPNPGRYGLKRRPRGCVTYISGAHSSDRTQKWLTLDGMVSESTLGVYLSGTEVSV
jgi:hypothetical protein